jgi:hypothetical protein
MSLGLSFETASSVGSGEFEQIAAVELRDALGRTASK